MGTVVQNKILMGLIFWTSLRVDPKKIKIKTGRTVFRFLGINFRFSAGMCSFYVKIVLFF